MNYGLLILGMMAVTFLPRYLPFLFAARLRLPPGVEQSLNYVPIAVLTIIVVQTGLYRNGEISLSVDNPYLGASLVAFIAALAQKRLFVTIAVGLVGYVFLRYWI